LQTPRQAHFPGRAPIDAYGNGGFRFAGMSHRGSLLCLPSGIYGWEPAGSPGLDAAALERILAETERIDVLLVGTGREIAAIGPAVHASLRARRIVGEPMSTGAAVRTYNVLLGEGRAVAAALVAVT